MPVCPLCVAVWIAVEPSVVVAASTSASPSTCRCSWLALVVRMVVMVVAAVIVVAMEAVKVL